MAQNPTFLSDVIARVQEAGHMPQMLARMIEINNLNGSGKMQFHQIPYPLRAIAHDHLLVGPIPAAIVSLPVEALAELGRRFDGPDEGGGIRITDGIAFCIAGGLGEDA